MIRRKDLLFHIDTGSDLHKLVKSFNVKPNLGKTQQQQSRFTSWERSRTSILWHFSISAPALCVLWPNFFFSCNYCYSCNLLVSLFQFLSTISALSLFSSFHTPLIRVKCNRQWWLCPMSESVFFNQKLLPHKEGRSIPFCELRETFHYQG